MVLSKTCLLGGLMLFSPATLWAAQSLSFGDCSPAAIGALKTRIFTNEGAIRPIVFSRDVLHLVSCEGTGKKSPAAGLEAALKKKYKPEYRTVAVTSDGSSAMAVAALDACAGQSGCTVEVYRRKNYQAPKIIPFAKSGGLPFSWFLGHAGKAGHYEIAERGAAAAARLGGYAWSRQAMEILRDAARDADFYEWGNPAAHAQTRNDDASGKISQDQAAATAGFEAWSRRWIDAAENACKENRTRDALYLLGYSLHGIQDLVFHEGITNAEHSFRDFIENLQIDAVDHYDDKMQLAAEATVGLLHGFKGRIADGAPKCWARMVAYAGDSYLYARDKEILLGKNGKDFGVSAYFAYRGLSTTVRDALTDKKLPEQDFFISSHWLHTLQRPPLDAFVARIVARNTH